MCHQAWIFELGIFFIITQLWAVQILISSKFRVKWAVSPIGQIHDCDLLEKRKSFYLMHERQQGKEKNNQTAKTLKKKHDSYDI